MYVLVIGRSYPDKKTGMMGIFEFEQAVAINKFGFESVYAFCDTRSIKLLRLFNYVHFNSNNVPVYGYHLPIGGVPRQIFDALKKSLFKKLLKKIIKEHGKPAIIHVHYPLINLNAEIWKMLKYLNVPIVVTEHWSKVQLKTIEEYRIDLLKIIVEQSNSFNCVGINLKNSVLELTNTKKDIHVIPNMIKPVFNYKKVKEKSNKFEFISIGRLVETKRFKLLINAFSKAFSNNKNVYLNIVGDGPLFKTLQKQIQDLGMTERIIMHGFLPRDKTADILKKSDVFVSASIVETFGVPFIEAMACGKPVVGVETSPISIYINKSNGVLFQEDNLESLINSLKNIYRDRNYFNGKQISIEANNLFSEKAIARQLINTYKSHLKN